ncbi:MAG: hypothetical protein ISQ32_05700 [Rickettsiales bacterium]|nr:hypothetical protein [Rickettsiales bacterium]
MEKAEDILFEKALKYLKEKGFQEVEERLSKRKEEVLALCQYNDSRFITLLELALNESTSNAGALLIENANGLAHLCKSNDIFHAIVDMSISSDIDLHDLAQIVIKNSIGIASLMQQTDKQSFYKIVSLYEDIDTRPKSMFIIENIDAILALTINDHEYFNNIINSQIEFTKLKNDVRGINYNPDTSLFDVQPSIAQLRSQNHQNNSLSLNNDISDLDQNNQTPGKFVEMITKNSLPQIAVK